MSDESTRHFLQHLEQDPELAASEGAGEELDDEQLKSVAGGVDYAEIPDQGRYRVSFPFDTSGVVESLSIKYTMFLPERPGG